MNEGNKNFSDFLNNHQIVNTHRNNSILAGSAYDSLSRLKKLNNRGLTNPSEHKGRLMVASSNFLLGESNSNKAKSSKQTPKVITHQIKL